MSTGTSGLGVVVASFLASAVEFVEAFTIVLAMGLTRGWRSALWGVGAAIGLLAAVTAVGGYAVSSWVPESALQLGIGTLLLVFGLQWLRKAILRASGLKALHDEDAIFRTEQEAARHAAGERRLGLDWFGFTVSFKGVFLEGMEVVFIVITFGVNARSVPLATVGAASAGVLVLVAGALAHGPLARVPENTIKFVVGLLLTSFGTFWTVEGLGVFAPDGSSLAWPGHELALVVVIASWSLLAYGSVRYLRRLPRPATDTGSLTS